MGDMTLNAGRPRRRFLVASGAWAGAALAAPATQGAPSAQAPAAFQLDGPRTALLLIDLQNSNAKAPFAPLSFTEVVANGVRLGDAMRRRGGMVIYTRAVVQKIANLPTDVQLPPSPPVPKGNDLVPSAGFKPGDTSITKDQFGAFYRTNLEDRLRRHRITTIVLGGVATEAGVESTARAALDRRFALVFAKDAMSGASARTNDLFIDAVFPALGRVRTTAEIVASLNA